MEQALESSRWAGKPFWDIIKPEATGAALTEALHSYAALWVGEDRHASSKGAFFRLGEHAQVSDGFMGGSSSEPTIGALNERLHALMAYITAIEEGHAPPSLVAGRDAFGQLIAEAPWATLQERKVTAVYHKMMESPRAPSEQNLATFAMFWRGYAGGWSNMPRW